MTTIRFDSLRALRPVADMGEVEGALSALKALNGSSGGKLVLARWGNAPAWLLEKPSDIRLLTRYGLPAGAQLQAISLVDGPNSPSDVAQFGQPLGQPRAALPTTHLGEEQMPAGGLPIASLSMPALLQCLTPLLCRYAPGAMRGFNNLPDGFEDVDAGLVVFLKDLHKHFGLGYWKGKLADPTKGFYAQTTAGNHTGVFHEHYFEGTTQCEASMRAVLAALLSTPTHKATHVWMAPDKPSFRFSAAFQDHNMSDNLIEGLNPDGFHDCWIVLRDRPGMPSIIESVFPFEDSQECADQMANVVKATQRANAQDWTVTADWDRLTQQARSAPAQNSQEMSDFLRNERSSWDEREGAGDRPGM